jgi:hypothetical protein
MLLVLLMHRQYQHRQCKDPRAHERSQDEGGRLQHRIIHVLHPIHSPRSSKQHDTEEASSVGLAKCDNVLLGYVACLSTSRMRSELAARCHHYLSRRHSILCRSCDLPRSARSIRGRLLSRYEPRTKPTLCLSYDTGCIYLLSMYYKRYELQLRVNLFFSASILAGAFSGVS